jgi:hypothetical protein
VDSPLSISISMCIVISPPSPNKVWEWWPFLRTFQAFPKSTWSILSPFSHPLLRIPAMDHNKFFYYEILDNKFFLKKTTTLKNYAKIMKFIFSIVAQSIFQKIFFT